MNRTKQTRRRALWAQQAARATSPAKRAALAWDCLRTVIRELDGPVADRIWQDLTRWLDGRRAEITRTHGGDSQ